jgi:FkbH-like protein
MTAQLEPVRLVIWDLDETFWRGTLTEGGIDYVPAHHEIVIELARRGIVSSICSKNDIAPVRDLLSEKGLWDYFIFPSIDWTPKGQRLAALVEAVQLRPQTVLFVDDNPMNRAEALQALPGIQVADETTIAALLDNPLLRGKDDSGLTRLAQYKLLERRQADERETTAAAGGDNLTFLRGSGIKVSIEHDLEPHLDRAIELINRTNQLNFTKKRLLEDTEAARFELRELLASHVVQAGIVRVRDNYGDYGYCGLYIMRNQRHTGKKLLQFCFSCRILNMGIETWLYRRLDRPQLTVQGDVLTDVFDESVDIDWISVELPGVAQIDAGKRSIDTVFVRGGCDMRAISHYFGVVAGKVIEEFNTVRGGAMPIICHSLMAMHALRGIAPEAIEAARPFGYIDEDFSSFLASSRPAGRAVWVLGFSIESSTAIYRHSATGALIPVALPGAVGPLKDLTKMDPADSGIDPVIAAHLRAHFTHVGVVPDDVFVDNVRTILASAPPETKIFILLANETMRKPSGQLKTMEGAVRRNALISQAARQYPQAELMQVKDFMVSEDEIPVGRSAHFDRMVYFRIFQHIMSRVSPPALVAA